MRAGTMTFVETTKGSFVNGSHCGSSDRYVSCRGVGAIVFFAVTVSTHSQSVAKMEFDYLDQKPIDPKIITVRERKII